MRNIVSPLDGFLSPFGRRDGVSTYAILRLEPPLVLDFIEDYYRTGGSASTFDDALNFSRASAATYTDADGVLQTAAAGAPRRGNHVYNGSEWVNEGLLLESEARTNLLHTTNALVTQSYTVTAVPHTLHFTGTGTVTLSGASTAGPLVGTGAGEQNRVSLTFTPTAASLTLTVTGTVTNAQLEVGSTPSSYIPNLAGSGTVTRAADLMIIPAANMPWPEPEVIGPELVTNGTFDDGLTGWIDDNSYWAVVSGAAFHASTSDFNQLRSDISAHAGKLVYLTFDVSGYSGFAGVRVGFRDASNAQVTETVPFSTGIVSPVPDNPAVIADGNYTWVGIIPSGADTLSFARDTAGNNAEFSIDNISVREVNPLAVSIQMDGAMTGENSTFASWTADANNGILVQSGANDFTFTQEAADVVDTVTGGSFTDGVNTPFNIASRHGSTFINGAVDGTALTENDTPKALPDLSATDFGIGPTFMGTIGKLRVWAEDLTDEGIEEAST